MEETNAGGMEETNAGGNPKLFFKFFK